MPSVEIKDKNGNRRTYCDKGEVKLEMRRLLKEKPEFAPFEAVDDKGKALSNSDDLVNKEKQESPQE